MINYRSSIDQLIILLLKNSNRSINCVLCKSVLTTSLCFMMLLSMTKMFLWLYVQLTNAIMIETYGYETYDLTHACTAEPQEISDSAL